jgi:hypothetical protein
VKLKIALMKCQHCRKNMLAVVDADGESTRITADKCHNSWKLLGTFETDIPDEFLVGVECPVHHYAKHGKEAEELRAGIQKIIKNGTNDDTQAVEVHDELSKLLDEVDACDSLAYLERRDERKSRRTRKANRVA